MSIQNLSAVQAPSGNAFDAIVVGGGFAGMYMLYRLRALGMRARVFEAGGEVGGTWYWNRYPGARCDVNSIDYSYSFSDELQQEWNWSEKFAAQPELLRYARFVADKFDLRKDIQFDTRVVAMAYGRTTRRWTVTTDAGERFSAQFCIMATGCLSIPKEPEIPGLESFAGPVYFTSRWPHEDIDFTGKTVGLIGTGSSGIQAVPEIARAARNLKVFQRTPSFSIPARNAPLTAEALRYEKAHYSERREQTRRHPACHLRPLSKRKTFSVDAAQRRQLFEKSWEGGGLDLFGEFGDLLVDQAANDAIVDLIHEKIDEIVANKETAAALKPRDYPFGGRRICLDTAYYETFNRDNVELVNLLLDPIDRIVAEGVKTRDTVYALDALVLATGFDAMTGALLAIDIRGRDGRSLREKWASGPAAYLGIAVEGFPNLFTITGPGSPSVLSNVLCAIEQHVQWVSDLLHHMRERDLGEVDALAEAETDWVRQTYEIAQKTLMMKASSWYLGANVPSKPRVFMPYVGGLNVYRDICTKIAADDYPGFHFT